ncbi:MAG: TetR family transcriptional regulator [Qingshengfaniella sp.]
MKTKPTSATPREPANQHRIRSEATRARILAAAYRQFVTNGLEGTRMEAIASEAGVNKSLVYRHFGTRDGLYREVLRRAYEAIRQAEAELELPDDPLQAIDTLVSFTLHYYIENPDFIVLVGIENLNQGEHIRQIDHEGLLIPGLVERYDRVIRQGQARGLFRDRLNPVDLFSIATSLCWFTVATASTFGRTFDQDVFAPENIRKREILIRETVHRYLLRNPNHQAPTDGNK